MKKYKCSNRKRMLLFITEILIGFAAIISFSFLAVLNLSAGINTTSSAALLTSIAILITNEYMSKSKTRYTKVRYSINDIIPRFDKTLKQSMVDKKK